MKKINAIKKVILGTLFTIGFLYVSLPGPTSIADIPPLPDSLRSDEPGDTYQNPNNTAFFSHFWRDDVTNYYQEKFQQLHCCTNSFFGLNQLFFSFIPPIRLNHPPEESFQLIRDQQKTTYLEQYFYPLRDALYVNGYEPFYKNGKPFDGASAHILINGTSFDTKTTLRYYGSPPVVRIIVYVVSWILLILMYKLFISSLKEKV